MEDAGRWQRAKIITSGMKAVIIGAGIIGLSSAYYLHKAGYEVVVLDKNTDAGNCSYGNAGMIVPSHFLPLPSPGIVRQGLRWLMNAESPLYIRPSLDPALLRWGFQFMRFANERHAQRMASHLRDLHLFSKKLYEELSREPGFDFDMRQKGILVYYKTEKGAAEEGRIAEKAVALGLPAEQLSKAALDRLEPGLQPEVLGAIHYHCDAHLMPQKLMEQLSHHLEQNGVQILRGRRVTNLRVSGSRVTSVSADDQSYPADVFVLAGGHHLPRLSKLAGVRLPMIAGKGYSFTRPAETNPMQIPALLSEARVAITPFGESIRYGGTMEIGQPDYSVNMRRVKGIVASVNDFFPCLDLPMPVADEVWYGFRPCTPDGFPYLGRCPQLHNTIIAGGHAMMGMSLGPASGKIVAELAAGISPSVNIETFAPARFL